MVSCSVRICVVIGFGVKFLATYLKYEEKEILLLQNAMMKTEVAKIWRGINQNTIIKREALLN